MAADEPIFHIAFYKFVDIDDVDAVVERVRALTRELLGSVLLAGEGINGVLAGTAPALDAFEQSLCQDARFAGMVFKRSACRTAPFARIKVHRKREIVAFGIDGVSGLKLSAEDASHVSPQAWRELIARDDVVLLDNRNSFEWRLGRFNGAVDPQVANFRDFAAYVQAHAPQWQARHLRVAMYCTGGIRCEKTSAWMQGLGLEVYQLDGGILNYFQAMPDAAADWQGECFVFDNRVALDTHLQETSTTAEQVYAGDPDEAWRLERARRLDAAGE
nr:rhodanese-like domain-containing protein [uncultured Roseateles sp.]